MVLLSNFEITIWCEYHHGGGFVKSLFIWPDEDAVVVQEQIGYGSSKIDENREILKSKRDGILIDEIIALTKLIRTSPLEEFECNMLGSSTFGIRIVASTKVTTIQWIGTRESIDEEIRNMYEYVENL